MEFLSVLTSVDHPTMPSPLNTLPDTEAFTYDGGGNRTMTGYAHDANHRMRASPSKTFDFDDDGNLKTQNPGASQASYTWDLSNQLASYSQGSTSASYVYDPFGRRIKKTVGSTTTWFLWNGPTILAEFNGSGTRQRRTEDLGPWTHGQVSIGATVATEANYRVHADRLETPKLMTTSAGTVVWKAVHEAYGKAHLDEDPDGNSTLVSLNARFPGQQFDAENGGHYNRARYYGPEVGRFLSADPIGQVSGLNLYPYASNSSPNRVDPLGLIDSIFLNKPVEKALKEKMPTTNPPMSEQQKQKVAEEIREEMTDEELDKLRDDDTTDQDKLDIISEIGARVQGETEDPELKKLLDALDAIINDPTKKKPDPKECPK